MNNAKMFEVGKKYSGEYGTYTIAKRTNLFVTLSNGRRCKVRTESLLKSEVITFKRGVNYCGAIFEETEYVVADNEAKD